MKKLHEFFIGFFAVMLLIFYAIFLRVVISKNKMLAFPECLPESGKLDIMLLGDSFGSSTRPRHNNVGHSGRGEEYALFPH